MPPKHPPIRVKFGKGCLLTYKKSALGYIGNSVIDRWVTRILLILVLPILSRRNPTQLGIIVVRTNKRIRHSFFQLYFPSYTRLITARQKRLDEEKFIRVVTDDVRKLERNGFLLR
ncbi:hypothetical protein TNCT_345101 [Trichonephila clavata]|uniref:Uncharacterized protein n=1 Tax=Trichonephila clavata TaxID=2740835 RepID=A0A8X6HR12_TRICU|nr:hypothetical protein TNCT_345101 [Trichonephila clavata]